MIPDPLSASAQWFINVSAPDAIHVASANLFPTLGVPLTVPTLSLQVFRVPIVLGD